MMSDCGTSLQLSEDSIKTRKLKRFLEKRMMQEFGGWTKNFNLLNISFLTFNKTLEQLLIEFFNTEFVEQTKIRCKLWNNNSFVVLGEGLLNVRQDVFIDRLDYFHTILCLHWIVKRR